MFVINVLVNTKQVAGFPRIEACKQVCNFGVFQIGNTDI